MMHERALRRLISGKKEPSGYAPGSEFALEG
jgi:hypothetical protein